ncbi:MAG: hypothetical protein HWE12_07110, partial [Oceanospirillaceae bacterium]|nr:hypothetical protein [Oceanospirillaceae bacterium]
LTNYTGPGPVTLDLDGLGGIQGTAYEAVLLEHFDAIDTFTGGPLTVGDYLTADQLDTLLTNSTDLGPVTLDLDGLGGIQGTAYESVLLEHFDAIDDFAGGPLTVGDYLSAEQLDSLLTNYTGPGPVELDLDGMEGLLGTDYESIVVEHLAAFSSVVGGPLTVGDYLSPEQMATLLEQYEGTDVSVDSSVWSGEYTGVFNDFRSIIQAADISFMDSKPPAASGSVAGTFGTVTNTNVTLSGSNDGFSPLVSTESVQSTLTSGSTTDTIGVSGESAPGAAELASLVATQSSQNASETGNLVLNRPVPNFSLLGDSNTVSLIVPSDTFSVIGGESDIVLSMTLPDGSPLPEWLDFNPVSGRLYGEIPAGLNGVIELQLTARDKWGNEVSQIIRINLDQGITLDGEEVTNPDEQIQPDQALIDWAEIEALFVSSEKEKQAPVGLRAKLKELMS